MKKKESYNIAIVGAGGLVGRKILSILEERNFPVDSIKLFATERSAGKKILYKGLELEISDISLCFETAFKDCDIAFFAAGREAAVRYASFASDFGAIVIDNSSYWRHNSQVPLIVPEVNANDLSRNCGIIANPNCSTIELCVALKPISDNFGLKRVIVSTYQSISGAGQKGLDQLNAELNNTEPLIKVVNYPVAFNTNFHSVYDDNLFSEEENKMMTESLKILNLPDLKIASTCVRLPFFAAHGEAVNIETETPFELEDIINALKNQEGICIIDKPFEDIYPTVKEAADTDLVYVGRIRRDPTVDNGLFIWITADNLRKGAATNAVQIAELLIK